MTDTTGTVRFETTGPDGKTISTGPISIADFERAAQQVANNHRVPMKHTAEDQAVRDQVGSNNGAEIRAFIERFERLAAEKTDIADAQKEVMAEAKGRGYDTKVLRKIIAIRKRDADDVAEEEAILDLYKSALGM